LGSGSGHHCGPAAHPHKVDSTGTTAIAKRQRFINLHGALRTMGQARQRKRRTATTATLPSGPLAMCQQGSGWNQLEWNGSRLVAYGWGTSLVREGVEGDLWVPWLEPSEVTAGMKPICVTRTNATGWYVTRVWVGNDWHLVGGSERIELYEALFLARDVQQSADVVAALSVDGVLSCAQAIAKRGSIRQ
jgi:hypothetical protein